MKNLPKAERAKNHSPAPYSRFHKIPFRYPEWVTQRRQPPSQIAAEMLKARLAVGALKTIMIAGMVGLLGLGGCAMLSDDSEPHVLHPTDECYSSAWHAQDVPSAGADPMWELFCEGEVFHVGQNSDSLSAADYRSLAVGGNPF